MLCPLNCRRWGELTWGPGPGWGQRTRAVPQKPSGSGGGFPPCRTEVGKRHMKPEGSIHFVGTCLYNPRVPLSPSSFSPLSSSFTPSVFLVWVTSHESFHEFNLNLVFIVCLPSSSCLKSSVSSSILFPLFLLASLITNSMPPTWLPHPLFPSFLLFLTFLQEILQLLSCWVPPLCTETQQWIGHFHLAADSPPGNWCPAHKHAHSHKLDSLLSIYIFASTIVALLLEKQWQALSFLVYDLVL